MYLSVELENELHTIAIEAIRYGHSNKEPAVLTAGLDVYAFLCSRADAKDPGIAEAVCRSSERFLSALVAMEEQKAARIAKQEADFAEMQAKSSQPLTAEQRADKAKGLVREKVNGALASQLTAEASRLRSMVELGSPPPGVLTRLGVSDGRQQFSEEERLAILGRAEVLEAKAIDLLAQMSDPSLIGSGYVVAGL